MVFFFLVLLMQLLGATLYAIANLLEEHLVVESPIEEVLGQLGMWGTLMCGLEV
jgi:solute carrier family 35 protein F1/2